MEPATFDETYVRRLAAGEPAIEQHFAAYFGELLGIKLRGRVRSPELAQDVRQETLLRVIKNVRSKTMEHPERLGAYVNAVCNNVLHESFRSESRYREMGENEEASMLDERPSADQSFVSSERKQQVRTILESLPEKDRALLTAVFIEERDKDEVCREFGVDRNYLRVLLHRARQRFRSLYARSFAATPR